MWLPETSFLPRRLERWVQGTGGSVEENSTNKGNSTSFARTSGYPGTAAIMVSAVSPPSSWSVCVWDNRSPALVSRWKRLGIGCGGLHGSTPQVDL